MAKNVMAKNVGELNGLWGVLFRLSMVVIPLGIVYSVAIGTWLVLAVVELQKFQASVDPKGTEIRVTQLEIEAARHGWAGGR